MIAGDLLALTKQLRVGDKLPSVRELSKQYGASPLTISQAIASLAATGAVRAEPGRGTFVASGLRQVDPDYSWQSGTLGRPRVDAVRSSRLGAYGSADDIQLSWGYLAPELQPLDELRTLGGRAARSSRAWSMAPAHGLPDLRRVFAAELGAEQGDVVVVPGGQQALVFAMRTLGEPGSVILTESPTYPGAILASQTAGMEMVSIPSDSDGILPHKLAEALERTRSKMIYLQPGCANPTGTTLPNNRRSEVLALAKQHGAFVLEDDWARHLSLANAPAPSLFSKDVDGHVVSILTLTKVLSPGLRIGALVARGPAGARLRNARIAEDMCVPPLMQEIALGMLTSPAWNRHLRRLRSALLERRDVMVHEVTQQLPDARIPGVPKGGIHLWVKLPEGADPTRLVESAQEAGVLVGNGGHFFVDEAPGCFIRLSYGAASIPQISEGIRRLAKLEIS
ncbi:putative transcriptional regulator, GntR family protein (plasmid) [Rhodococcus qingshengii]|uniref:aminotransferase-like domain-containing protein n=1 Tax=Rhodococcus qingshengii TaxID=334542 RepID=UPI000A526E95|nr:PLP-dependent aminotransferase family protein [Rhodococcus qingshengii]BCF86672.1 putative transcriptional regulator, GntR family protein [Rhodococcus qingshengii]